MSDKKERYREVKKNLLCFMVLIICNTVWSFPKMLRIKNKENNLNIEISETLVTMKDYKEYINDTKLMDLKDFEEWKISQQDIYYKIEFNDEWPVWGISWRDAVEYCNWLSKKNGFSPCYIINKSSKGVHEDSVTIVKSADGYRLPYVREILILSGFKDGLDKEQYERENLCNMEININRPIPAPVYEGRKNKYGIYDLLGNLEQYCNDYYLEGYNYYDYSLSPFGPETFTPDPDEVKDNGPIVPIRCYCGNFWGGTYERIGKQIVFDVYETSKEFLGIRLVRERKNTVLSTVSNFVKKILK